MENKPEKVTRPISLKLDKILGKAFKVLDDGFVRVVDYLGTDDSIVQAARVSYGKGTKKVREDRALIRYLMRYQSVICYVVIVTRYITTTNAKTD